MSILKLQASRESARILFRKGVALLVAALLAFSATGCAGLQRKFTRKKKEPTTRLPRYRPVRAYEKKPAPELYQKHYTFWSTWHSELLAVMGKNNKKDARCISEIISNLRDMQGLLLPEKGEQLEAHIAKLENVREKIIKGEPSVYNTIYVRNILEREEREIKKDFRYKKLRDYLKKNTEDGL